MPDFNYNQDTLDQALKDVEDVLAPMLAKARQDAASLQKSEGSAGSPEGTPAAEETPGSASAEGSAGSAGSAGGDSAPPAADGSAPAPDAGAAPAADPAAAAGPVDPQALVAEYAKLSPQERAMHLAACQEAMKLTGEAGDGAGAAPAPAPGPDASAAPAPAPAAPATSPSPAPAPAAPGASPDVPPEMGKTETPAAKKGPMSGPANGENPLEAVKKAEAHMAQLEAKLAKFAELEKELETLKKHDAEKSALFSQIADKLMKPMRKAVTEISQVPVVGKPTGAAGLQNKSPLEGLSKSQVTEKIKNLDQGKLTKSDREAINRYVLGDSTVNAIEHLFTK